MSSVGKNDLRVILLAKAGKLGVDACRLKEVHYENPKKEMDAIAIEHSWIALGHFDALYTYALPLEGQFTSFKAIGGHNMKLPQAKWEDGIDGHCSYLHPLYITKDITQCDSDKRKEIETFWNAPSPFIFVTRVFCKSGLSGTQPLSDFEMSLTGILDAVGITSVSYQCYHTMELSDLVLIFKSNSASDILKYVYQLYASGIAGDLYSYCGVSMESDPDDQDIIEYCSMRFSISNRVHAHALLNGMLKTYGLDAYRKTGNILYMVTGNDDIIFSAHDAPSLIITKFLRELMGRDLEEDGIQSVITQIGTADTVFGDCMDCRGVPSSGSDSLLTEKLARSREKFAGLLQETHDNQLDYHVRYSWLHAADKLLNTLVRMSRSCVMDEFCYLVYDGVSAFFGAVSDTDALKSINVNDAQTFVSHLGHLMEHIMRVEGQLVNQPEMRPLLYDVSPMILEYILAFADMCSEYFSLNESSDMGYSFFLIPKLCRRIKIDPVALDNGRTPNRELLQIEIPLHLLYDLRSITRVLCHEVSHFSGETTRCREDRFKYYILACTYCLAHKFDLEYPDIANNFCANISSHISADDKKFFARFQSIVFNQLTAILFMEPEQLLAYLDAQWPRVTKKESLTKEKWKTEKKKQYHDFLSNSGGFQIKAWCDEWKDLFKECYADICMIHTLNLDCHDYIALSARPELESHMGQDGRLALDRGLGFIVQRTYAVLSVVFSGKENLWDEIEAKIYDSKEDRVVQEFIRRLCEYHHSCHSKEITSSKYNHIYYPHFIIETCLMAYLSACYQEIENKESNPAAKQKREKICNVYNLATNEDRLDSEDLRGVICDYRERMLSR